MEANYFAPFAMEVTGRLGNEAHSVITQMVPGRIGANARRDLTRLMYKWNAKKIIYGRKLMCEVPQQLTNIIINSNLHERV